MTHYWTFNCYCIGLQRARNVWQRRRRYNIQALQSFLRDVLWYWPETQRRLTFRSYQFLMFSIWIFFFLDQNNDCISEYQFFLVPTSQSNSTHDQEGWNHFTCKYGDTSPSSLLRRWPYTYYTQLLSPEWQVEIVMLILKFHPTTAGSTNEINGHPKLFRQDHIGKFQHSTGVPESRHKITCIRSPTYRVQLTFHYIWRNWRCNQIGYLSVALQSWCQHNFHHPVTLRQKCRNKI